MIAKHKLLGLMMMVGAVVATYAVVNRPQTTNTAIKDNQQSISPTTKKTVVEPLTADIDTETKILAEKQREREARVLEQEAQTKTLLAEQQKAKEEAIKKAQEETASNLVVQTRPEVEAMQRAEEEKKLQAQKQAQEEKEKAEQKKREEEKLKAEKAAEAKKSDEKAKQAAEAQAQKDAKAKKAETGKSNNNEQTKTNKPDEKKEAQKSRHTVQTGDTLIRLSREYGVPVSALAAANNMGRNDALLRGSVIKIPSKSELAKLEQEAKQAEKAKAIDTRLKEARQEAKKQGVNDGYMVQVSLAANKANADALVEKYKKAGYRVKAVEDARGLRVVIGPERSQEAANALKDKINNDPNVDARGAWVLKMKP